MKILPGGPIRGTRRRSSQFRIHCSFLTGVSMEFPYDVCVVGGCGRAGLPLALSFAHHNLNVCIHDINDGVIEVVKSGKMPFLEEGADAVLKQVLGRTLSVANDVTRVSQSHHVIVLIGTPVDEHLNPTFHAMRRFFDRELLPNLVDGQCIILRSTVFPGTTAKLSELVSGTGRDVRVAFCPERTAEGFALRELAEHPQIVSGCDQRPRRWQPLCLAESPSRSSE